MPDLDATVATIIGAPAWNARVNLIRQIPEQYGRAYLRDVYARLAQDFYVPKLASDFAYIPWPEEFELASVEAAYQQAYTETEGFTKVSADDLTDCLLAQPATLRIFRLLLGFTPKEFAAATQTVATDLNTEAVTEGRIKSMENGRPGTAAMATVLAETVVRGIARTLFPPAKPGVRSKQDRPDLAQGWATVHQYATDGVPLYVFLHQRHYGGAFNQLLNSTGSMRGNVLEQAVKELAQNAGIPFIQTGSANQSEIQEHFNITVHPAPDFVFYDANESLRGMLECKLTNDGGTARDKAGRFGILRQEADRLGGIPVFAMLGGLGWTRTRDALGPVVQACDGRVFTLATLPEMLTVDPFPAIAAHPTS